MNKLLLLLLLLYTSSCTQEALLYLPTKELVVSTIGDSRFTSFGGDVVRETIVINSFNELQFVGNKQDSYGYNHDAVGGDDSEDLLQRYDSIPNADVYVILFGTNDLWRNSIDVPFETLSFIIEDKLSQGSIVYYCKQTPRNDYRDSYHIELDEAIINEFDGVKGFDYIDLRTPLLNTNGTFNHSLYDDHVHPNYYGGEIMGREIANKINTITYR